MSLIRSCFSSLYSCDQYLQDFEFIPIKIHIISFNPIVKSTTELYNIVYSAFLLKSNLVNTILSNLYKELSFRHMKYKILEQHVVRKVQRNKVWGFICIEALVEIIKSEYIAMRKTIEMRMSLTDFWKTIAFKHGKAYLKQGGERANSSFFKEKIL